MDEEWEAVLNHEIEEMLIEEMHEALVMNENDNEQYELGYPDFQWEEKASRNQIYYQPDRLSIILLCFM